MLEVSICKKSIHFIEAQMLSLDYGFGTFFSFCGVFGDYDKNAFSSRTITQTSRNAVLTKKFVVCRASNLVALKVSQAVCALPSTLLKNGCGAIGVFNNTIKNLLKRHRALALLDVSGLNDYSKHIKKTIKRRRFIIKIQNNVIKGNLAINAKQYCGADVDGLFNIAKTCNKSKALVEINDYDIIFAKDNILLWAGDLDIDY